MHFKHELINYIIEKKKFDSYLELGLGVNRETFDYIKCDYKIGVDNNPATKPDFLTTTDEFFKQNLLACGCCLDMKKEKIDCIFIDAYHEYSQVNKDFFNSLAVLNHGGIIFMHDVGPLLEKDTLQTASGTAYLSWMDIRRMVDLNTFTYQFNDGDIIGIVIPGKNQRPLTEIPVHSWTYYNNNKDILLNKKTLDEIDVILGE